MIKNDPENYVTVGMAQEQRRQDRLSASPAGVTMTMQPLGEEFQAAIGDREGLYEPAGVGVETEDERMSDLERKVFEILTHGFPAPFARVRELSRRIAALTKEATHD